jgi:hypothetical protein
LVAGYALEDGRDVTAGSKFSTAMEKGITILNEEEFLKNYYKPSDMTSQTSAVRYLHSVPLSKCSDTRLWVDKHRPQSVADLIGHQDTARKLSEWLQSWSAVHLKHSVKVSYQKDNPGARAVLLSGPPGTQNDSRHNSN